MDGPFGSPSEVYSFIDKLIGKLHASHLNAQALERIQSTAYTTSSEWLGELGVAVRTTLNQPIVDDTIKADLKRLIRLTKSALK